MINATHAYVGKHPVCGCIACDAPGLERSTAKDVADWIKRGMTVERVPLAVCPPRHPVQQALALEETAP